MRQGKYNITNSKKTQFYTTVPHLHLAVGGEFEQQSGRSLILFNGKRGKGFHYQGDCQKCVHQNMEIWVYFQRASYRIRRELEAMQLSTITLD